MSCQRGSGVVRQRSARGKRNSLMFVGCCCCALPWACVDTGSDPVVVPLSVGGVDEASDSFEGRDGWEVTITDAQIVFGPLRLCAGTQAGAVCETARAEWLDAAHIDLLSDAESVGELLGSRGMVRSWMFDLGLVSLLTQSDSFEYDAVSELDGASVRLQFAATDGDQESEFLLELPIEQSEDTEQGVPVVRSAGAELDQELDSGLALTVWFDPRAWLSNVDFAALSTELGCEEADEACAGVGEIPTESQAYRAVRAAIGGGRSPEFEWSQL